MFLINIPVKKTFGPNNIGARIKFVWYFTAAIACIIGGIITSIAQDW